MKITAGAEYQVPGIVAFIQIIPAHIFPLINISNKNEKLLKSLSPSPSPIVIHFDRLKKS
ncbi:MAG: hypothetical protein A2176_03430 [Spirochaetes bacterium RBG_13_51_14]|nr:MAG: hypothetical protein A2176_03430 [Spirochaetes bacterium RBG_13_51_14]